MRSTTAAFGRSAHDGATWAGGEATAAHDDGRGRRSGCVLRVRAFVGRQLLLHVPQRAPANALRLIEVDLLA